MDAHFHIIDLFVAPGVLSVAEVPSSQPSLERAMNPLSFPLLVREALLQNDLPEDSQVPTDSLRLRLYCAAITLVPPSPTVQRGVGDAPRRSDDLLLKDFLQGDASAFEALIDRHLPWMTAWARKHLPPDDAEDVAQEAFIDLVKKVRALSLQAHTSLRGLLFGFLRTSMLRASQAQARRRSEPLEDEFLGTLADSNADPETSVLTQSSHAEIAEALARECTLLEQEVLLLTLEGRDDTFIATALGISVGYVRVLRHRAVVKLRKALGTPAS